MKIAVTGATGHLGINLVPELLKTGSEVRVFIHEKNSSFKELDVEIFRGNILDQEKVEKFIYGTDVIIHLAARISISKNSSDALKVNIEGTRNVLNSILKMGAGRLIHFSSIHSLKPEPLDKAIDETRELNLDSRFDYDRSKAESEKMVLEAAQNGLDAVVLNPTAVIGPNDWRPSILGRAIIGLAKGNMPAKVNGGYDWVDARDIVNATLAVVKSRPPGNKYMLSGHWKSMKELGEAIHRAGGARPPRLTVPFPLAIVSAGILNLITSKRDGAKLFTPVSLESLRLGHRNITHARAYVDLGFKPRPFEDTIMDTVSWFRDNNYL